MARFLFLFLSLMIFVGASSAQVCSPVITNQDDINNFPANFPGCKHIDNLELESNMIDNLDSLYSIESIGYFRVYGTSLEDLGGMSSLKSVDLLEIYANNQLKNIDGLSNLERCSLIVISGNSSLISIEGLISLDTVNTLAFYNNDSINTLNGLENLKVIKDLLSIGGNYNLVDFSALNSLEYCNDIGISGNENLEYLNCFENLKNNEGDFSIGIFNSTSLKQLPNLKNIKSAKAGIHLAYNPSLVSLSGLDSLEYVGSGFEIRECTSLLDLKELSRLRYAENLYLYDLNIESVNGLESLDTVDYALSIRDCPALQNLIGLSNLEYVEYLYVSNNPSLTECMINPICEMLTGTNSGNVFINENGPGCFTEDEVRLSCGGLPIIIRVLSNETCLEDSSASPASQILVKLSNENGSLWRSTNTNGEAVFTYLDTGMIWITLPQFPTSNWDTCQNAVWINLDTVGVSVEANILINPLNVCPQLHTELTLPPFFRGCLVNSTISVTNQNVGGTTAENTLVGVVIPSTLEVVTTTPPVFMTSGDTLFFHTGTLEPFQDSTINITVHTSCDTFLLGSAICLEAFGYLDNPCPPLPEASDVRVYSECLSDTTIRFTLKNILGGSTQNPHEYIIIEDEIVLMTNPFNLGPFGTMTVDVPANAATYRMEATRLEDGTLTATAREGCGGFTPGLITAFWLNTHLSDYDYDCREVVAAYDPNQKTAIPKGIGEQHLLPKNIPITYTIEFQNTGTDTAFRVLLRDILSEHLDVTTFRPLGATHPYTWEIRGGDTLEVLFQPIALPDSNVNEVASHGWFSFNIHQKKDLADGTLIENTASIIFDFNPPIITNTTFHTIGELTVGTTYLPDHQQNSLWKVSGNPVYQKAVFSSTVVLPGTQHFSLINAAGTTVTDQFFTDRRFEFDRLQLPAGLYYYTITDERGKVSGGKLMLE